MRLTNFIREDICHKAMLKRFQPEIADLIAFEKALADRLYNRLYSKKDQARMMGLPAGMLNEHKALMARFGSEDGKVAFDGRARMWGKLHSLSPKDNAGSVRRHVVERRIYSKHTGVAITLDHDDALTLEYLGYIEHVKVLEKQIGRVERQIITALKQATTAKSLIEKWPEIAPFVDYEVKAPVPALPIAELNQALHLGGA